MLSESSEGPIGRARTAPSVGALSPSLGLRRPLRMLVAAWGVVVLLSVILLMLGTVGVFLSIIGFMGGSAALIVASAQLLLGKSKAIKSREAVIWNGFARLISWNPTEGILLLKNKQIDFVDDNPNDGGGIRVLFPFLGEELVLRVPLEIQTLSFRDAEVLTKEYMPLTIQGTMYWRVCDLERFYLYISKEMHAVTDEGAHTVDTPTRRPQLEVAEQWLRLMAEERTRTVVSRIGTGLLISDQLITDLPKALPEGASFLTSTPEALSGYRNATDGLAETIKTDFQETAREYGLEIHRVALQEVKLPPEIYTAAIEACKSAYLPLKAQAEALERRLKLQAEADVIGKDATGLKEIAANIPALAFQEFLSPLFLDFNRKRGLTMGLPIPPGASSHHAPPAP